MKKLLVILYLFIITPVLLASYADYRTTVDFKSYQHTVDIVYQSTYTKYYENSIRPVTALVDVYLDNSNYKCRIINNIMFYSYQNKLSPVLVSAIIAKESSYRHRVRSHVGARGLMQVMPFWKHHLGTKHDNLYRIDTNIWYGTSILKRYMNTYDNYLPDALAAYNGSKGSTIYYEKVVGLIPDVKG